MNIAAAPRAMIKASAGETAFQTGGAARLDESQGRPYIPGASARTPPTPREERSRPAAVRRLTSFCTVGAGRPVSSASCAAETRTRLDPVAVQSPDWPQCRAAAVIVTTA